MIKIPFNNKSALVCLFAIACALMLPMAFWGIPDSYDLPQHIRFANAYLNTFMSGGLIPQWAGNDNFGLGSVGIRFYPPFAYFFLAGTRWLVGTWYDAFWINSLFWMFMGCTGVYLWAREWLKVPQAFLAAVLYAIAPYHTFQIYQAVLFSEFAAAGIIPFCFLFLTRTCRKRDFSNTLLFSMSVALLLLTHIPSSVIGSVSLGVYAILIIDRRRFIASVLRLGIAAAAALAASAFNWIKLVTEMSWVRHNTKDFSSTGFYDYQR